MSTTSTPSGMAASAGLPGDRSESDLVADIIVVGAGVTGCAAAVALADGQRRILVLEARSGHKPRFAGELIHPTGAQVLDDLGFLETLRRHGGIDVTGFAVVPPRTNDRDAQPLQLPYAEIPQNRPTGFAMEHRDLVEGMREVLRGTPGVELRMGHKVDELLRDAQGRVCGVRSGEQRLYAQLVLGCDGRHSKVRPLLGLSEAARLLSFSVAFRLPGGAKLLPCPGYGHIVLGAWGPMLLYPIGGPGAADDGGDARGCFDVTSELSGGPRGAAELLRREYAPHLPAPLRAAMLDSLERELPQIAANEAIRTDRAVLPGAAIVGDAGGCSHPLTATGMTVGFTDAQRLGRLLAGHGRLQDHAAVDATLRDYEIARYRFVRAREILADALYEVFRAAEPGTRAIRAGIMRYWQDSERARARSMALLSGADSRLSVFLREYLKVVTKSSLAAWSTPDERGAALLGLGQKSLEKMRLVARDVGQEARRALSS